MKISFRRWRWDFILPHLKRSNVQSSLTTSRRFIETLKRSCNVICSRIEFPRRKKEMKFREEVNIGCSTRALVRQKRESIFLCALVNNAASLGLQKIRSRNVCRRAVNLLLYHEWRYRVNFQRMVINLYNDISIHSGTFSFFSFSLQT